MSTNPENLSSDSSMQTGGVVWNRLHSEREEICEALLRGAQTSEQTRTEPAQQFVSADKSEHQLQERLRLIDDALDRLMAGSYGDCSICGRWIEDTKLDADPALPFCFACQRRSESEHRFQSLSVQAATR